MNLARRMIIALAAAAAAIPSAHACRYNVRDVGFVDFGSEPYKLYGFVDNSMTAEDRDSVERILFAALIDSNIESEIVNIGEDPRDAPLARWRECGSPAAPALALVSETRGALNIPLDLDAGLKPALWEAVDKALASPARTELLETCINTYGAVLLVEGNDAETNEKLRGVCAAALESIADSMDSLPKEIRNPPELVTIPQNRVAEETVLLWSLGMEAAAEGVPHAAVLYARGRQIGGVLKGNAIVQSELANTLSMVGLSCECGLDRSWMMGTMFPLQWSGEYRQMAMQSVGFDPGNPLVKTEISQIMARGAGARPLSPGEVSSPGDPLMGYAELSFNAGSENSAEGESGEFVYQPGMDLDEALGGNAGEESAPEAQEAPGSVAAAETGNAAPSSGAVDTEPGFPAEGPEAAAVTKTPQAEIAAMAPDALSGGGAAADRPQTRAPAAAVFVKHSISPYALMMTMLGGLLLVAVIGGAVVAVFATRKPQ